MLQPTTGVAGRSQLLHSSAWFLDFLLCIPLLLLQFGFSFPPFFFSVGLFIVWDFLKAIIGIFAFCTQLVILQGQCWEMLDLPEVHADSQM